MLLSMSLHSCWLERRLIYDSYIPAKVTIVAINAAAIVAAIALRVVYGMRNRKAEGLGLPARSSLEKRFTKEEGEDLYPGFRYVY